MKWNFMAAEASKKIIFDKKLNWNFLWGFSLTTLLRFQFIDSLFNTPPKMGKIHIFLFSCLSSNLLWWCSQTSSLAWNVHKTLLQVSLNGTTQWCVYLIQQQNIFLLVPLICLQVMCPMWENVLMRGWKICWGRQTTKWMMEGRLNEMMIVSRDWLC